MKFLRQHPVGYDFPVTGPFGATSPNPPWSPLHPHMGADFGCPRRTPVYAPASGRCVQFTNDGTFGKGVCLFFTEDGGWFSLFAHLDEVLVKVGQWVEQGTLVGFTGNTSNVPIAYHLHWQFCRTSKFVRDLSENADPITFLTREDEPMTPEERKEFDELKATVKRIDEGGVILYHDEDGNPGEGYDVLASVNALNAALTKHIKESEETKV